MAFHPARSAVSLALASLLALAAAGCADESGSGSGGGAGDRVGSAAGEGRADGRTRPPASPDDGPDAGSGTASDAESDAATDAEPDAGSDTGSGSENGSGAGTGSETGSGAEAGEVPWCATAALSAELTPLSPGAGQRYAALVLTNASDNACRTQGWPGLQLATGEGEPIPTTTVRDRSEPSRQLTLQPGASAWARLHWSVVASDDDPASGDCGPTPATLQVIPPDTYNATGADWGNMGEVCSAGRIEELPLAEGEGPAE
jgi:hypothetical protein